MTRFNVASKYKRLVMSTRYKKSPYTARVMLRPQSSLRVTELQQLCNSMRREVHKICSRKHGDSILRSISSASVTHFSWQSILQEIKSRAPTLYFLIKSIISKQEKQLPQFTVGIIAGVLLKHRNKHLCLPQALISVVMYAGHCSKEVSCM